MEDIKYLFKQIKIISNKNAEILDMTGTRFNIFKICGVNHYENTHSAILAEFLSPSGSHSLKSKLLECFIKLYGNDHIKGNFDCDTAIVITEYSTDKGRIDIFIKDNQENALIIENKIYSVDQREQLKRYDSYAKNKYKNYQIFYLTLWGSNADDQSGESVSYTSISYQEHIIEWLEQCVRAAVHYPMVRETINQYSNHLKTLTNQDMDTKNNEELIKMIVDNPSYINSALQVSQIWKSCKYEIINRLKPHIRSIAEDLKMELFIGEYFGVNSKDVGFSFRKPEWGFSILFWFQQDYEKLSVGIDTWGIPEDEKNSAEKTERLKQFLEGYTINKYIYINWIWGTRFEVWSECPWEEKLKKMPDEIKKITDVILKKLLAFEN